MISLTMEGWLTAARSVTVPARTTLIVDGATTETCVYYDPVSGRRCFIGAALPIEFAKNWRGLIRNYALRGEVRVSDLPSKEGIEFLDELQEIHDLNPVEEWPTRIDSLENRYKNHRI